MPNRWTVSALVAVVAAALLLPADATAARRFRVRVDLAQTGGPVADPSRCAAPTEVVFLEGTGNGAGLGRVTVTASHCIIDDPADPNFGNGLMTISGGRGDIFLSYSGTDTGGVLEGTFTITGGTGAYAGATGGGTFSGLGSATEQRGSGVLEGTIDF
jgi:hypothetical protein